MRSRAALTALAHARAGTPRPPVREATATGASAAGYATRCLAMCLSVPLVLARALHCPES